MVERGAGVSVVICTLNGADRLRPTLTALSRCEHEFAAEIVLVDNACTDGTPSIAETIWRDLGSPFPLRIVAERHPGLAFARRTGVRNAVHDVVVFCDDDNHLAPDYLQTAAAIMADDSEVGAVGGASVPLCDTPLPPHFYRFASYFAVGSQAERTGPVNWLSAPA